MKLVVLLLVFGLFAVGLSQSVEENLDPAEPETKEHSAKKYTKENQKPHHHGHKHKKHLPQEDTPKESPKVKKVSAAEIPEAEVELQHNVETSKKAVESKKQKENTEDLHLQDLAFEEELKKKVEKKRAHHQPKHVEQQGEPAQKRSKKESKLFAEVEAQKPEEKVIEDSFAPIKENHKGKKNNKNKESKNKENKNKHNKKSSHKNKDKKNKSKNGKSKKEYKNKGKKW